MPPSRPIRAALWSLVLAGLVATGALALWPVEMVTAIPGEISSAAAPRPLGFPRAGRIAELRVADGEAVEPGAVIARLDLQREEATRTALASEAAALLARAETLAARLDRPPPAVPAGLDAQALAPARLQAAAAARAEAARRAADAAARQAQIGAINAQRDALRMRLEALAGQRRLLAADLQALTDLSARGHAPAARLRAARREDARLAGEIALARSELARLAREQAALESDLARQKAAERAADVDELARLAFDLDRNAARRAQLAAEVDAGTLRAPEAGRIALPPEIAKGVAVRPGEPVVHLLPDGPPAVVASAPAALAELLDPGRRVIVRMHTPDGTELRAPAHIAQVDTAPLRGTGAELRLRVTVVFDRLPLDPASLHEGMPADVLLPLPAMPVLRHLTGPLRKALSPRPQ